MANHLQVSRLAANNLDDEDDYEEMPESRAVLAEREHGAAMIRVLEQQNAQLAQQNAQLAQQNAQLVQHNAELAQQVARLVQQGLDDRQNERLDRQIERRYFAPHIQQHAGGQANQQVGGRALAGALRGLADVFD